MNFMMNCSVVFELIDFRILFVLLSVYFIISVDMFYGVSFGSLFFLIGIEIDE